MQSARVEPAYANFPRWHSTLGPEVGDLAALAGMAPDPEQAHALDVLFGTREDGRSASFEFAIIAARQNLKSSLYEMAVLGWLFVTDQRLVVWSAHEMRTTNEAFLHLIHLIEGCPSLRKRLAPGRTNGIIRGNGFQGIELASGQRILFKARTHGGGRGLSGDKVILDEAFALKPSHMGSLLPTLSARPDPQVCYGATAGQVDSEVLRNIRDRGRKGGDPSLAYLEFCAPEDICADENCTHHLGTLGCAMDDIEQIRKANPALERRISIEYIRAERRALPPEEFGRERMGWWDKPDMAETPMITPEMWSALTDRQSAPLDPVSFSVYVNLNRTQAAIGVAGRREDGRFHVGIIPAVRGQTMDSLPGTGWIAARVRELVDEWSPCAVVIDGYSAAASLLPDMEKLEIDILTTNASDMARACGAFYDAVTQDNLRHTGAAPLTRSVLSGKRRELVDAWAWDRKDRSCDITQLVAVTLALHGLVTAAPERISAYEDEDANLMVV